ncbi:MAG: FAD-dependent oxidoreductase, partial [Xanthomonadales bacterium]|nr:FAD-dependent oxidoreductase [Xanthomonadales bacterium]
MSRRGELDAIVVGAGIVGTATALALARDGFDVALVEAQPPTPWNSSDDVDLRVVALAPDGAALFDDLGVWTTIREARVGPYRRMVVWDALAPGELVFDALERGESALGWIVENRLLQHALWTALVAALPPDRLACPSTLADIEDHGDAVTAVLGDGTRRRARVLIGADGIASPLRDRLGIGTRGRDYGQRAVVAHVTTERAHDGTAWQRFQPGGPLAFLP